MSGWDETRFRLRASCNGCNESKVRCSQRKPTCARCERNETECIYGLSRRTHKDAPPISIPPSQRGGRGSRVGRPKASSTSNSGSTSGSTNGSTSSSISSSLSSTTSGSTSHSHSHSTSNSTSASNTGTPSNRSVTPDESAAAHHHNTPENPNLFGDYMFPTAPGTDYFSSLVSGMGNTSTAMAPGQYLTTGAESGADYANQNPWMMGSLGSLFGTTPIHNNDASTMANFWARNGEGECSCHAGVTELLASMRGGASTSSDQRQSLDAQLAKLKRCIVSSETSMACAHGQHDSEPIHIMAVAMLIGYVIDDFKMLARSQSLSSSMAAEMATFGNFGNTDGSMSGINTPGSTSNLSLSGLVEPRLSWGVLELEDDDEMDLRQRLFMLSFRKLERLLSQLTLYLRDLHNARASLPDPSRHMAFVIACDYTRLWLEKKAGDVKRLFPVTPRGDEAMMDL